MKNNEQIAVAARMSKRLIAIAGMLSDADNKAAAGTVADVGCDHGYVSIYLVQSGIASRAIAMDVRKGPLAGADTNIREYGLCDQITTRLSDGLKALEPAEADALVIAGMGGKLMIRILEEGDPVRLGIRRAVLQPQSDIDEFRRYLRDKGYQILDEQVIFDEGKYYFPMKVSFDKESLACGDTTDALTRAKEILMSVTSCDEAKAASICDRFGEYNIIRKDMTLKEYLEHGREVTLSILKELEKSGHTDRYDELRGQLEEIECVLKLYN